MPKLPPSAPEGAETVQDSGAVMPVPAVMPPPPPQASRKHIEVIATGIGFYDNHRKAVDDRFTVPNIEMCGSWMKCVDPKMERERIAFLKAKKQKANTADN